MRRFFTAAGLLLSGSLAASAQTMGGCADIGINPTPQLNDACTTNPGSSGEAIGGGSGGSGMPAAMPPLVVPNDPVGESGTIDRGTTSAIPGTPLVVPNNSLRTEDRGGLSSGDLTPGSRSGAIPSPSID